MRQAFKVAKHDRRAVLRRKPPDLLVEESFKIASLAFRWGFVHALPSPPLVRSAASRIGAGAGRNFVRDAIEPTG
jgi:hypothetical protein